MSSDSRSLTPLAESDYEAIEQAVMETTRGRWFLKEYAARNRNADTGVLLDAISRLEKAVTGEKAIEQVERVRFDLVEMSRSIGQLKAEIGATKADGPARSRFDEATATLDDIARATQSATSSIVTSTEGIQELAWTMRERAGDEDICDRLDRLATEIYTACSFQDVAAQRTEKVVRTIRFLEGRINGLVDAWDARDPDRAGGAASAPPPASNVLPFGHGDDDIDIVLMETEPADNAGRPTTAAPYLPDTRPMAPPPLVVDDSDLNEVAFIEADAPAMDHATAAQDPAREQQPEQEPAAPPARIASLAEIDAMPAAAKALIFG